MITQELELVCEATANITPTLTWLRKTVNETTVVSSASPRFNITKSVTVNAVSALSVLRVESVETADAGEYVCRASGNNDSVAETSTLVHVRGKQTLSTAREYCAPVHAFITALFFIMQCLLIFQKDQWTLNLWWEQWPSCSATALGFLYQ